MGQSLEWWSTGVVEWWEKENFYTSNTPSFLFFSPGTFFSIKIF
jgi:hypothetical protein